MRRSVTTVLVLLLFSAALVLTVSCASRGGPAYRKAPPKSAKATPESAEAPSPAPGASFDRLPVIAESGASRVYAAHLGVRPTVDTRSQPSVTLTPEVDTASFHLAQALL